ncbi:MAG TPA: hypothetical protein VMR21_00405, partial [Vicinamibacteria bacterium]|nr:hypothetical protein [Vicinamibacteria bacterium]
GDFALDGAVLARYAGTYQETEGTKQTLVLSVEGPALRAVLSGPPLALGAIDAATFRPLGFPRFVTLTVKTSGERVEGITVKDGRSRRWFAREEARP